MRQLVNGIYLVGALEGLVPAVVAVLAEEVELGALVAVV